VIGSFVIQCLFGVTWPGSDVDVMIADCSKTPWDEVQLVQFFQQHTDVLTARESYIAPLTDWYPDYRTPSDMLDIYSNVYNAFYLNVRSRETGLVTVINLLCAHGHKDTKESVATTTDLNICRNWFDGKKVAVASVDELVMREIRVVCTSNKHTRSRIVKYVSERGFQFVGDLGTVCEDESEYNDASNDDAESECDEDTSNDGADSECDNNAWTWTAENEFITR
jgi:hypothetical protein